MGQGERQVLSEPERIRALAHPLRLQLLELLKEHGDLTASECAGLTSESVASCSFHLRTLEKYRFIERAEPRGREKPWRLLMRTGYSADADPGIPGSVAATAELALLAFHHRAKAVEAAFARLVDEPPEWVTATSLASFGVWATASEMSALGDRISALLEPFLGRDDPVNRPDGARRARLMVTIHVDPPVDRETS